MSDSIESEEQLIKFMRAFQALALGIVHQKFPIRDRQGNISRDSINVLIGIGEIAGGIHGIYSYKNAVGITDIKSLFEDMQRSVDVYSPDRRQETNIVMANFLECAEQAFTIAVNDLPVPELREPGYIVDGRFR